MSNTDSNTPKPPERDKRAARLGFLVWLLARTIGLTLRVQRVHWERLEEAVHRGTGAIVVTWHGRSLIAANIFRHRDYWALISLSRDGEMQNHIFRRFGFQTVRGSTGRGGVRAVLQLTRKISEGGVLTFTPDGPRGPSGVVQQGTVFLAQRSGCPVVPIGISAWPRKLVHSWDRYMVPAPFAKCAMVIGEPITVPSELDDDGKARVALQIGAAISECEAEAERLVGVPTQRS